MRETIGQRNSFKAPIEDIENIIDSSERHSVEENSFPEKKSYKKKLDLFTEIIMMPRTSDCENNNTEQTIKSSFSKKKEYERRPLEDITSYHKQITQKTQNKNIYEKKSFYWNEDAREQRKAKCFR